MLMPSRSGVSPASSHGNDPTNQKKYTSHSAKPKAKRMLTPAMEKRPWRIVASFKSTPSPSRDTAHASRDLFRLGQRPSGLASYPASAFSSTGGHLGDSHDEASRQGKPSRGTRRGR